MSAAIGTNETESVERAAPVSVRGALIARWPYAVVAALLVTVDQITKKMIDGSMDVYETRSLIDGVLALTYVRNSGMAFGMLQGADLKYQSIGLTVFSMLALAAIVTYSMQLPATQRLPQTALALITGGALGNLIDRASLGYVIDFVDVYWRTHHWPMFNAADSAISVGVTLLILDIIRSPGGVGAPEMDAAKGAD